MKKLVILLVTLALTLTAAIPAFATTVPAANSTTGGGKAFREQFRQKQEYRKTLVTEAKSLWEQVKGPRESIKSELFKIKEKFSSADAAQKKAAAQDIKSKLQPSRDQKQTLRSDVQTMRDEKAAEWDNYKSAVQAKDAAKASTALDKIISLRQAINGKIKQLLSVNQGMLSILSGYGK